MHKLPTPINNVEMYLQRIVEQNEQILEALIFGVGKPAEDVQLKEVATAPQVPKAGKK